MYSDESAAGTTSPALEGTRERVLQLVLARGPVSAAQLGRAVGLTAAAVRRHLDALEAEDLVEVKLVSPSRGAGRPSRRYVVTHRAQKHFEDSHLDVALEAVRRLHALGGPDEVRALARERFAPVEERFSARLSSPEADLEERTGVLTEVLEQLGYASTLRHVGAGLAPTLRAAQVCQGHCPLRGIPEHFPQFCQEETALFARLLGVDVRRLSTLATGGHVCTTHVPLGRAEPVAST